jgi:carotenoid cleavage dioxygenase-like enzyme
LAVTVARIGPGRIRIGERKYDHWFDGDGQMTVMHLNGAKQTATITSRLVQTDRVKLQQVRPFLWPHQTATITSRLVQTDRVKLQQVRPFLWPHQTFLRVNGVFVSRLTLHRTLLYQQLKGPK